MAESVYKCRNHQVSGFTVLEVVIALAVVTVVALATFNLQNQGFLSYQRSNLMTHAVFLAQEKLTEAEISPSSLPTRGQAKMASGDVLLWEVAELKSVHSNVKIVRVRIRDTAIAPPILEVSTYVVRNKRN